MALNSVTLLPSFLLLDKRATCARVGPARAVPLVRILRPHWACDTIHYSFRKYSLGQTKCSNCEHLPLSRWRYGVVTGQCGRASGPAGPGPRGSRQWTARHKLQEAIYIGAGRGGTCGMYYVVLPQSARETWSPAYTMGYFGTVGDRQT